jgi:hypothetical protein
VIVADADVARLLRLVPFIVSAARYHNRLDAVPIREGLEALRNLEVARRAELVAGSVVGSDRVPPDWIGSQAVATHRGITTRAVTKAAKNRRLRAVKVGNRWWIDPKEIE